MMVFRVDTSSSTGRRAMRIIVIFVCTLTKTCPRVAFFKQFWEQASSSARSCASSLKSSRDRR
jgi:hypothetical protein